MNLKLSFNIVGVVLVFISLFMTLPVLVSYLYNEPEIFDLSISFLITFISGITLYFFTKKFDREELSHREAFFVVTLSWLVVAFFGAIPYILTGTFQSITDAYFESMAGFTTTGSSVLRDIEVVSKGVLFWRSITQWVGGMGIILFALAILPMLGTGGMQLFKAEVPEISVDRLKPRIIDTAKALWIIYVGLTTAATLTYMAGGMNLYDALCHSFTTLATGGFSTKNMSVAHFNSAFIDYSTTFFMFLAGVNYSLYFYVFRGSVSKLWKNSEFKFYLAIVIIASVLISINIWGTTYESISDSFRYSVFQVVSIMTTTGYATADFERWSSFAQIFLVILMLLGGMIGSTGGGIKQVRILLMLKQGYREMYQLIHPRAVTTLKLDGKFLTKEILGSIWGFLFLFIFICVVATIGMASVGTDIVTAATTVISAMCNVGPALGTAGPAENFASIPDIGKWILTLCMLTGRLEVYTVLILFIPNFWKK